MNMLPSLASQNRPNCGLGDAVPFGECDLAKFAGNVIGANGPNVVVSDGCKVMAYSAICRTLRFAIGKIVDVCVPAKIRDVIVCRIVIWSMARLHALWTRADEGFKHKAMNKATFAACKLNMQMT